MAITEKAIPIQGTTDILNICFSVNHRAICFIPIIAKGYKELVIKYYTTSGTMKVKYVALNNNALDETFTFDSIKSNNNIILTPTESDTKNKRYIYDVTGYDLIYIQIETGSSNYPNVSGVYSLYK